MSILAIFLDILRYQLGNSLHRPNFQSAKHDSVFVLLVGRIVIGRIVELFVLLFLVGLVVII